MPDGSDRHRRCSSCFVVLMASNTWLEGIFGYSEIATHVPFLLCMAFTRFGKGVGTIIPTCCCSIVR